MPSGRETILITGAAGYLGSLVARQLLSSKTVQPSRLILCDISEPKRPVGSSEESLKCIKADLCKPEEGKTLFETSFGTPSIIYCLHGIMSRGAEDNFDLGMAINVDSVKALLDLAKQAKVTAPIKFIFTSSVAVFGGPLPSEVSLETATAPESSYGCAKRIAELYVNEYTRRGFVDGRICRLPTIAVRPGPPAAATSAFISGIIREPIQGQEAICPIGDSFDDPALDRLEVWVTSPSNVIDNLVLAKDIPADEFKSHTRVVNLPGFTVTIKQELEALRDVVGQSALDRVIYRKDAVNARIVGSFPRAFNIDYALSLGLKAHEGGFRACVEDFVRDLKAGQA